MIDLGDGLPIDLVEALEAVRRVAEEYGLATSMVKPCVALLLDGHVAERHEAAFVIAIEFRRMGYDEKSATRMLSTLASKIAYRNGDVQRAVRSAFLKQGGTYKYWPPGIRKKGVYARVLEPTCTAIGCPANCPPFANVYTGTRSEGFARFEQLGWPSYLRSIANRPPSTGTARPASSSGSTGSPTAFR